MLIDRWTDVSYVEYIYKSILKQLLLILSG